jgi:CRISPR-associated endoribonuclease Cas6
MQSDDLGAFVCVLRATRPLTIQQHMGRAAQQLCLDLIGRADPALAEELHGEGHAAKPYAVSGLLSPAETQPVWGAVSPGDHAWLRLVGLRQDVVAALETFADQPPASIELDRAMWDVESVVRDSTAHPWAGRATYGALLRTYQFVAPAVDLALEFAAPTGFHSNGLNVPLPEPSRVFDSLLRRWNDLSGCILPDGLEQFVTWQVVLSRYRAETRILSFKGGSKQVGFVGQATFHIVTRNTQFERTDPDLDASLAADHDDLARALGLLAEFAFYCGVGIKTTTGMGMVRRT